LLLHEVIIRIRGASIEKYLEQSLEYHLLLYADSANANLYKRYSQWRVLSKGKLGEDGT
jgi:hypothetical protein